MDIMLEIVSRQKHSASFPVSHVFGEAGGYIGRSHQCEWMLPDRTKKISRKHALITFEDGAFFLEDLSANGVFLTLGHEPVGKEKRHRIEHGEGFLIGDYSVMARLLHDPGTYSSSDEEVHEDLLSMAQNPLSLDPLKAMEEEEERIARHRLGDFDDLLVTSHPTSGVPSDHCDPRTSTLQPVVAIPESEMLIPEDWDSDPDTPDNKQREIVPSHTKYDTALTQRAEPTVQSEVQVSTEVTELLYFFKALGFDTVPATPTERERILRQIADLVQSAVQGMMSALQNRAECKNELRLSITTTNLAVQNNPLKFSPNPKVALAALLGPTQKGVLPAELAMREGFNDLHRHHMGLMAGARAVVRATLDKVAPTAVEAQLDMNGPVRLRRKTLLWRAYIRLYQALNDDNETFSGLFLQDFSRAYEMQGRTLAPASPRISKGNSQ